MTANHLVAALIGRLLVQFRMGCGVHLELGEHFGVTIDIRSCRDMRRFLSKAATYLGNAGHDFAGGVPFWL